MRFFVQGGAVLNPSPPPVRIVGVNTQALFVGPSNSIGTLVVNTSTPQVSMNANLTGGSPFSLRVANVNQVGVTSADIEISVGNTQAVSLSATGLNANPTKVELFTNGAWPLNLGYNNALVVAVTTGVVVTSAAATALTVGPGGTANPVFSVDASTAAQATGIKVTGNAAGAGVTLAVTSSAGADGLTLTGKGGSGVTVLTTGSNDGYVMLGAGAADAAQGRIYFYGGSSAGGGGQLLFYKNNVDQARVGMLSSVLGNTSNALAFYTKNNNAIQFGHIGTALLTLLSTGLLSIGQGTTDTPTYALQCQPTGNVTANQTFRMRDATAGTGITGIFFDAGDLQGTNPILTVAGSIRANQYNIAGTDGIDASITTGSLVGKTITVQKGIITGFA